MAYDEQIKARVLELVEQGVHISVISERFNISSRTISKWKKQREAEKAYEERCAETLKRLAVLIHKGNFSFANELASGEEFRDNIAIQSQRITCLIGLGRIEDALTLASENRFKDNPIIQTQRATCLMALGRKEEALTLASENHIEEDLILDEKHISSMINKSCVGAEDFEPSNSNLSIELLQQIKNLAVDSYQEMESVISASGITSWQQVVLMVAMYERVNYPAGVAINYLERQRVIYENNESILAIIQALWARVKTKNKRYDTAFYKKLLLRPVNLSDDVDGERGHLLIVAQNLEEARGETRKLEK